MSGFGDIWQYRQIDRSGMSEDDEQRLSEALRESQAATAKFAPLHAAQRDRDHVDPDEYQAAFLAHKNALNRYDHLKWDIPRENHERARRAEEAFERTMDPFTDAATEVVCQVRAEVRRLIVEGSGGHAEQIVADAAQKMRSLMT